MPIVETPECFENHMGLWAIQPTWFSQVVAAIRGGLWSPGSVVAGSWRPASGLAVAFEADAAGSGVATSDDKPYAITSDGIAVIEIRGPMMKGRSKFGGCSTMQARRQIRAAVDDPDVRGVMMLAESPGGKSAGTQELADDVYAARRRKPVHGYYEDLGGSACCWVMSQCSEVSANAAAIVGSIGTYAVLVDASKAMEAEGMAVHLISTGPYKGAGSMGTPILPEHLEHFQQLVHKLNQGFLDGVRRGRGLSEAQLARVTDGREWIAEDAMGLRLIDRVEGFDGAMARLRDVVASREAARRRTADVDVRTREARRR